MARRANVGDIVKELNGTSSRGVLIVGSRGTGKTWTLGQILAALDPESVTIRLAASKALSAIPFGAVNARIGANLVRSNDYYQVLNGLLEQISESTKAGQRVFLMVDNAEHLDSQSAAIIIQVVMSTEAKLILVDQPGGHNTHLRELWRDGHLTRFELAPLRAEEVQAYLEGVLGGKVARPAADYLTSRSAGNPLVLQGLVAGAEEEGSLRKVNNVWILDHPADQLGVESWEFLQMELDHVPPGSRRIIEILALAGPLPLDALLDLTGPESVDDIQQRELVEIVPGEVLTMRLARQATAASIRAIVPVGRSRRLLSEVAQILPMEDHLDAERIINFTRWSLDCGLPVSKERILEATVWANQLMRPIDALQFSNNKTGAPISAELTAERAIAFLNKNLPDQARALALRALDLADTPQAAAAALRAVHLGHASEVDYEKRFNDALARHEDRFGATVLNEHSTRADIDVLLLLAARDVSLGDVAAAETRIHELLAHPGAAGSSDQVLLKSLLCEMLSATGQLTEAVEMAMEVIGVLEHPAGFPRPDIAILAYSRSVAAFIYDGAWNHVEIALDPETFTNPDMMLYSGGLRDLAEAMMHCRRGHIEQALVSLESAVGALGDYDPWSVLSTALGLLAYCQVMHGDLAGSQESLKHLASQNRRSGKFYELDGAAYAAAAQFMTGQAELGLARLRSLQRECFNRGYLGIELTVLALLARIGDTASVPRLAEASKRLESTCKEFYVEWSGAMQSQDPSSLDRASAIALDYGFELVAVELATQALKKFHDRGKIHKSRKTASKVVAMREQMPGVVSPVFQSIDQPKMTRREHQIALLVARGESNNSIAERLNVSLRTIEGHLYRTFIKLDIQSREQLAALMNGDGAKVPSEAYSS